MDQAKAALLVGGFAAGVLLTILVYVGLVRRELSEGYVSVLWGLIVVKGKALIAVGKGGWGLLNMRDVIKGDKRNTGQHWIKADPEGSWRIRYGALTKPQGEGGKFVLRVYRRDPKTRQLIERLADITTLGPGAYAKNKESQVFTAAVPILVQVDAETNWWAVRVEDRE